MWRRIFDMENPVMQALGTVCDLLLLNVLAVLCCLPVVTAGASLTALNDVSLHLVRKEEENIARMFFRSFRSNLKKGSLLGLIFLAAALVFYVDYRAAAVYAPALRIPVAAAALIVAAVALYAFALLARYENTIGGTLKNAASLAVAFFPKTLGMLVFTVGLWTACLHFARYALPVLAMFGLSLPVYVCALLYDGVLRTLEETNKDNDA